MQNARCQSFRQENCFRLSAWIDLAFVRQRSYSLEHQNSAIVQKKKEQPSVLRELCLVAFDLQASRLNNVLQPPSGRTCAQTIDMQADSFSQAKRHLFLSFLVRNHYVTMQFPVLLYSDYKRKSISKHSHESRQVFEMVSRLPWTLSKPYKERFACIACIISETRRQGQRNEIQGSV